ncbi:probable sugar phosphate/phosphate translocator At1g06470 [Magnolia sinica]|uniref:probable sugar phosphate/phosphate translocator At1g06470 n=1 Tax=Magnolia sinica TaxID=86752 RepID=UPI00265AA438|nr:probable sugar phosphate/phosphate translocator At1g06470 [Magnolia sinica]
MLLGPPFGDSDADIVEQMVDGRHSEDLSLDDLKHLMWLPSNEGLPFSSVSRYNKTLLGDKLGKFPAPFLMNTIHFGMQAILSKAIVGFWSQKLQPSVKMSWRDYFLKVVPTAIGTALDINLSNVSLVFISVTFATMCKSASPIFLLLFAFAFK